MKSFIGKVSEHQAPAIKNAVVINLFNQPTLKIKPLLENTIDTIQEHPDQGLSQKFLKRRRQQSIQPVNSLTTVTAHNENTKRFYLDGMNLFNGAYDKTFNRRR